MLFCLDIEIDHISGIFTVPVSGTWNIGYSLEGRIEYRGGCTDWCKVSLYKNDEQLEGSESNIVSHDDVGLSLNSRKLSAGDTITLRADKIDGHYYNVKFLAEFVGVADDDKSMKLPDLILIG